MTDEKKSRTNGAGKTAERTKGIKETKGTKAAGPALGRGAALPSEEEARRLAADLGFRHFISLADGLTVDRALKHPESSLKTQTGVYLQFRTDGTLYIGFCGNLSARQQKHHDLGHATSFLAFLPCSSERLAQVESEMIGRALRMGLPLANRAKSEHAVLIDRSEPFDRYFPPELQDRFVADGGGRADEAADGFLQVLRNASASERGAWAHFCRQPKARAMLRITRRALFTALPQPEFFERHWWYVALGNSNQKNAQAMQIGLIAGRWNFFECFIFQSTPKAVFVRLGLATNVLAGAEPSPAAFRRRFGWVLWEGDNWREPAHGELENFSPVLKMQYASPLARAADVGREVTLAALRPRTYASGAMELMDELMDELRIRRALAACAVAGMRQTACVHPEFHNPIGAYALLHPELEAVDVEGYPG